MEKAEYIKQLKLLIKKYHPDLCVDEKLEPVYREITVKLNQLLNRVKNDNQAKIDENSIQAKEAEANSRTIHTENFIRVEGFNTPPFRALKEVVD
jgi:Zn-dependent M32 family carboxypeptidase